MEDIKIAYDGTVRNEINTIIQFVYGTDGFDAKTVERQYISLIMGSNNEFMHRFKWKRNELKVFKKMKKYQKILDLEYKKICKAKDFFMSMVEEDFIYAPININRIIQQSRKKYNITKNNYDITPLEMIQDTQILFNKMKIVYDDHPLANTMNEESLKVIKCNLQCHLSSKKLILQNQINRQAFKWIIRKIEEKFLKAIIHPGEMCGPISAQSLGERCTQLTLNSVDYNQKILIRKNKSKILITKIGEFIDNIQKNYDNKYQEYFEKGDQTLIRVNEQKENYDIWAVDWDGKYKWKELQAVTKHLPLVNGKRDNLVKITLESKRTAIGTKAKSFLRYNPIKNKLEPVGGEKIQIGDYVPITKHIEIKEQLKYLELEEYFPKTEYYYTCEIIKGLMHKKNLGKRNWFKGYNGKEFTVPYSRSDIMIDGIKGRMKKGNIFEKEYFYDKNNGPKGLKLPERFELDELFGFFIGAYLAEGLANKNQVKISNNDKDFRNKIYDFCDKYEIPYYTTKREFGINISTKIKSYTFRNRNENIKDKTTSYTEYNKTKNYRNGTSTDITIYHTLLSKLLKQLCNTGSKNKKVPEFCYTANNEFIRGLLDGYISGDGSINKTTFSYTTISEDLGYGIALLLKRFGIHTKLWIKKDHREQHFNDCYYFILKNYSRFRYLKLTHKEKMWKLFKHQDRKEKPLTYFGDNVLEKVIKKEEVESSHKYVYDLTIKDNPNFIGFNGIPFKNTFHSSGVSSKTKVNQGVPRLREIISATKKPKTPSMTIFLGDEKHKKDKTKEILNQIQYVPLKKFVKNVQLWYDKDPMNSVIESDRNFLTNYYDFFDDFDRTLLSPWVLRIEIDHQILFDKQIDMFFLYKKIWNFLSRDYHIIYSNDNSDIGKLVFHIRLMHSSVKDKNGNITLGRDTKDPEGIYNTLHDYKKLITLENNLVNNLVIMGIKGINKVYMREFKKAHYKRDGTKEYKAEYVLDTVGSNLRDILNLVNIDSIRTISNQIHEVYDILGIEAARNLILREINGVLKASGIYLNQKHLYLLCDVMTNKGYINTIDRHGMNKSDTGPLAKCSFEETDDQLTKAAVFSHIDGMKSIASSLIMGQIGNFGCGMVELDMELDIK